MVGYAELAPATSVDSNRHVRRLNGLDVDPVVRRRGVATALLDAAARKAELAGAKRLTLRVFATNSAALALYEEFGFEREGALRGEFLIGGEYVDDVLMALELPRPSEPRGGEADEDW